MYKYCNYVLGEGGRILLTASFCEILFRPK
jgi:hypothetical protein